MDDSTIPSRPGKSAKPAKPYKDFPLYAHAVGAWAKKVRGKTLYFGKIADDPKGEAALDKWLKDKDDLLAGRTPRANREGLTVRQLVNAFLTAKKSLLTNGEITYRTFEEAHKICALLVTSFGKNRIVDDLAADDFDKLRRTMSKNWGPVRLGNKIQETRSVFKYGLEAGLFAKPIVYGPTFKRPKKSVLRKARAEKGARLFEAVELRRILDEAGTQLKAMILLGINAGLGNTDIAKLPTSAVDLTREWLDYPRAKTGIERRCPLWPETVAALRAAEASRPTPNDRANVGLFFITKHGNPWATQRMKENDEGEVESFVHDDAVGKEFGKVLATLKLHRPGFGFYTLRHSFETIAGGSRDQVATDYVMGHADESMAAHYREKIDDARLKAVVDHVHNWLYGKPESPAKPATKAKRPAKPKKAKAKPERRVNRRPAERDEITEPFALRIVG